VIGHPVIEFYLDQDERITIFERLQNRETVKDCRARLQHADGSALQVLIDANGLWEEGKLVHTRWFVRDITERVALEAELVRISEFEKQRIGQELHDSFGQHLHALHFLAALIAKDLTAEASPHATAALRLDKLVAESLELARGIPRGLEPVKREPEGLMWALRELASFVRKTYRLDCRFECPEPILVKNEMAASHLYRIAQESVNNALKHGHPTRIRINLAMLPEKIILGVKDNGVGFSSPNKRARGMGLRIMQHRSELLNSSLVIQRRPRGGTEVICTVPSVVLRKAV